MPLPRVVLVEDNPSVRHFVELTLEELALDLVLCPTLADALDALAQAPTQLVLTDWMLPDGTGLDVLRWLSDHAATCPVVVFSAGMGTSAQQQLAQHRVWRVLNKPVSVQQLLDCVTQGLQMVAAPPATVLEAAATTAPPTADSHAVTNYFGGQQALYESYHRSCVRQFPQDLGAGDTALQAQDATTLRRVAHNLKAVLTTLGYTEAAQHARHTEDAATAQDLALMQTQWQALRSLVAMLSHPPAPAVPETAPR